MINSLIKALRAVYKYFIEKSTLYFCENRDYGCQQTYNPAEKK
jgi:hypothetical protein